MHQFVPLEFTDSYASGIDGDGNIVGRAQGPGGTHAFMWIPQQAVVVDAVPPDRIVHPTWAKAKPQSIGANGLFVAMDISAYRWLLESNGSNSTDPNSWYTFIDFVAARYANEPTVAFYYIMGEPAVPTDGPSADALVAFYDGVTTRFRSDDPNHLISAGGFNHMEDHPELHCWQRIYSLANNDIDGYKTCSQRDLDYVATVTSYTNSINKPAFEAEFGIPQYMGDCTWSGQTYNGINTSRTGFFANVYDRGLAGGTAAFVFWNLGNQAGDSSYNISPTVSPCTWAVIQQYSWPPAP